MFKGTPEKTQNFNIQAINSIGNGTVIEGAIKAEGDLRIDGKVLGNITLKGKIVLGASGEIIGDIQCQNATIEGKHKGNLKVSGLLQLARTANLDGNIEVAKLIVDEGAVIQAQIKMVNTSGNQAK
ncbi:MAG: polymer-forming cytoskeletal protein [Chitinophagales bacterium]|jgi:cytoskeletal protein CcmA (bactofilin family)|nr:polymer-forming cytoskeletal protein [Chitinophagales bacterium]